LVRQSEFREDLYYRINVIELDVPPLRDRGDDVFILSTHILQRLAGSMGVDLPTLGDSARSALATYRFPGNVRELENMLERAVTLCDSGNIEASDLPLKATPETAAEQNPAQNDNAGLGSTLENVERSAIVRALEEHRYNKTATAKSLGLSLRALRYRIQKLGIE
jgi:two-component system response regulator PilR (NtrC family)